MIKYNLVNSLIGNIYPFFLSNNKLYTDPSYYLYKVISPCLSPDLVPYISLEKISEKTRIGSQNEYYGKNSDIISMCLGNKEKTKERGVSYLKSILWRDNPIIDSPKDEDNFPLIEMENGNNIQKSIIIGLRDSLRWKNYKFQEGSYVDILWGQDTFMLFKFCGDKNKQELWIEPVGLYSNLDPGMKNPFSIDLNSVDYPKEKWNVGDKSEINRVLKKLEWESFNRSTIN